MDRRVGWWLSLALLISAVPAVSACGEEEPARDRGAAVSPETDTDGDGVPDADDADPNDATVGREKAVTGTLELERAPAGSPDAGTQAGHRGGEAVATTRAARFRFDGVITPAESKVTVDPGRASIQGIVKMVGDHGDFTVTVTGLRPGANRFRLRAEAEGYAPWTQEISITRK
jgi:hypothetical protein